MKRIFIFAFIVVLSLFVKAQTTTIAQWTFEDGAKRALITNHATFVSNPYTADAGTAANVNIAPLRLVGGAVFTAWVTGSGGTGTFAPNSNTWDNGAYTKYWLIKINTSGYQNLTISSRQQSSPSGPRDFQVEYSLDSLNWTVVPNSTITVANNFTSGVLTNVPLPAACNNKSVLYLRWVCTSTIAVNGGSVGSTGTNRIDDILITGEQLQIVDATIQPTTAQFNIDNPQPIDVTITWNDATTLVQIVNNNTPPQTLVAGVDYVLTGNQVSIQPAYLSGQFTAANQTHTLYFHFDVGNPATLTITSTSNTVVSAQVSPDSLVFDLTNPSNVSTTITWNSATSVVSVNDTTTGVTLMPTDYQVSGNQLIFNQGYLSTIFTAAGQMRVYRIVFDVGSDAFVRIHSISTPQQPVVLAMWNFENSTKRGVITDNATFQSNPYTADNGTVANKDISPIRLAGSTFSAWSTWSGMGFQPNAINWHNGAGTKYWVVKINTVGYKDIQVSSKQRSSSTGPRDFRLEYSLDSVAWTPVTGGNITVGDNFTDGVLTNLPLPSVCENKPVLYLRWVVNSTVAVNGSAVASGGTSRIDDISIIGLPGTFITDATIQPTTAQFNIDNPQPIDVTITWNDATTLVQIVNNNTPPQTLVAGVDYVLTGNHVSIQPSYLSGQFSAAGQTHTLFFHFDVGNPATLTITSIDNNIISAVVSPDSLVFDLTFPTSLQTTITWNSATSILSITDTTSQYVLQPANYSVNANTLTFQQSYLTSVFTQPGMERIYRIAFDAGDDAFVKIRSIMSPQPPVVLAHWNFENAAKRALITDDASFQSNPYTADDGIPVNKDISPILLGGGSKFSSWAAGAGTGSAPNTNAWNNGADTKYWYVVINTEGYGELTLTSKHRSSSTGPKNFRVDYSLDGNAWYIVPNSQFSCTDQFTTPVDNLPLPQDCENRPTLYLRWVMTDNEAVNGAPVASTGTSRIDDITIKGRYITDQADILTYYIPGMIYSSIDYLGTKVTVLMPYGTDLTQLVAQFTLSPNAIARVNNVLQVSGVTVNDFSDTVKYVVIAGDGVTQKVWDVIVTTDAPSTDAEILQYTFINVVTTNVQIDNTQSKVDVHIRGYNYNNLIAMFTLSPGATATVNGIPQISGITPNNFTQPVVYVVTAQDGITQRNWTVTVYTDDTGVEDVDLSSVSIHPNPASDFVTVNIAVNALLQVYHVTGQKVLEQNLIPGNNTLSIAHLPAGIYLLNITYGEMKRQMKLLKQ